MHKGLNFQTIWTSIRWKVKLNSLPQTHTHPLKNIYTEEIILYILKNYLCWYIQIILFKNCFYLLSILCHSFWYHVCFFQQTSNPMWLQRKGETYLLPCLRKEHKTQRKQRLPSMIFKTAEKKTLSSPVTVSN